MDSKWYSPQNYRQLIQDYTSGKQGFIPWLLPEVALQIATRDVLQMIHQRTGDQFLWALSPENTIPSPAATQPDGKWLQMTNMVGINVRTIDSFWNVIKYTLTLPPSQSSIHLLPVWEPGVVASLYGMSSWQINPEFFSAELFRTVPALDTVEKQLKVVVNLLHLTGRTVGMDVIPHTDRYSEIVLANPAYFEWIQRDGFEIVSHRANLHEAVAASIVAWLNFFDHKNWTVDEFWQHTSEEERLHVLFGASGDWQWRNTRRNELISHLYQKGYEPVPATMGPPYRGLEVNPQAFAKTVDKQGRIWRDYRITKPEKFSRAFGPLTRYKLYDRLDNNQNWEIDFNRPRKEVWDYVQQKYAAVQRKYGFDFMRGDMSHVQMRTDGVVAEPDDFYDIHRSIKHFIQQSAPYFGYFAESFLAPAGEMAYGDEEDHLERSAADTTLGDLQSVPVGSPEFSQRLRRYHDLAVTRSFAPELTAMTADKDDPRFDSFYQYGNVARLFMAHFLDLPSYMGLGFETRDRHDAPVANEFYTKLYVFQIAEGPKSTNGPYRWGQNHDLFAAITRLRLFAERLSISKKPGTANWLLAPDATGHKKVIAWYYADEPYIFVVNLAENAIQNIHLPFKNWHQPAASLTTVFSTEENTPLSSLPVHKNHAVIEQLAGGEGVIYSGLPGIL